MAPRRKSTAAAVPVLMVPDTDSLDCDICYLPLKPPIFECPVGHVVCSVCRDKLKNAGACHVCGGGYQRCHAMERVVDAVRALRLRRRARDDHLRACPHAPCHCPAGESCGFIGSTMALLKHIGAAHRWPCTTKGRVGEMLSIRLRDGFNFLVLNDHAAGADGDRRGRRAGGSAPCLLFLLNVERERLGRAISVLCIRPHVAATADASSMQCELVFSRARTLPMEECPAVTGASSSSCRIPLLDCWRRRQGSHQAQSPHRHQLDRWFRSVSDPKDDD